MKRYAYLLPYISIGLGLLVFRNAWIATLAHHLSMFAVLQNSRHDFSVLRPGENRTALLLASAIFGLAGGMVLFLLWPNLGIPTTLFQDMQSFGLSGSSWPYFIGYFILVNGWLEELYWRGYLSNDSGRPAANDFLFSGYHVIVLVGKTDVLWLIIIILLLTFAAWFWRQVNQRNKGITASVISHIAADASVMLALYFRMTG